MNQPRRVVFYRRAAAAIALTLLSGAVLAAPATAEGHLGAIRDATARYHRISVAEADGFARAPEGVPVHECIASFDGTGAMGTHWLNFARLGDAVLDPLRPEVLVYEPTANGRRRLVALEYIVDKALWDTAHPGEWPTLMGHRLHLVSAPSRYEIPSFYQLHAWIWKHNPSGMHEDFNPTVSCAHAR